MNIPIDVLQQAEAGALAEATKVRVWSLGLPWWVRILAFLACIAAAYGTGRLDEARHAAAAFADYVGKQAAQTIKITGRQTQVVVQTETVYRDRIKTIYVKGDTIEKLIPNYITQDDVARFRVNAGFVRVLDAAWSGQPPGPVADSDREPAGVPIDQIADNQTSNATSCLAWREQALGWRDFYAKQQVAINGKAGAWSQAPAPALFLDAPSSK